MQLYAEYIKEREDADIVYDDHGFMSYKTEDSVVLILDAYTKKECRGKGKTKEFLNRIIEKTNCNKVICTTDINANGQQMSENVILALGFEKKNKLDSKIYYLMEMK